MDGNRASLDEEEKIWHGYAYILHHEDDGVKHVTCRDRISKVCVGKGRIINGQFLLDHVHNHAPAVEVHDSAFFCRKLRQGTLSELQSVREIYDINKNLYPEAAATLGEVTALRKVARWRASISPPLAETYAQVFRTIFSEHWRVTRMHETGISDISIVRNGEGNETALVFSDPALLQRLAPVTELHIGSTDRLIPDGLPGTVQTLTVVANYHGFAIPCAWALMKDRAPFTYTGVFRPIFAVLHPDRVHTDFERGVHVGLTVNEPLTASKGDFTSYCRALLTKALALGLSIDRDDCLRSTVKKLMVLALLPSHRITEEFCTIRDEQPPEYEARLARYFQYYEKTWIRTIGPEELCQKDNYGGITNCPESIIKRLENKLKLQRGVWPYIRTILGTFSRAQTDMDRINEGRSVTASPRIGPLIKKNRLQRQWDLLQAQTITPERFLNTCSTFVTYLIADLLYRNERTPQNFIPFRGVPELDENGLLPVPYILHDGADEEHQEAHQEVREDQAENAEPNRNDEDSPTCTVCRTNGITHCAYPCIHVAYCGECVRRFMQIAEEEGRPARCAMCRGVVDEFKRAYLLTRNIG